MLKKSRPNSLNLDGVSALSNPGTSVSGSQDSDDDDLEDISSETETPSIERSLGFNVNSVSTESLDLVGQRENYFKNNFESMHVEDADNRKDLSGMCCCHYILRRLLSLFACMAVSSTLSILSSSDLSFWFDQELYSYFSRCGYYAYRKGTNVCYAANLSA